MNTMRSLRAIALAGSCLLPIAAAADDFDVADEAAKPQSVMPIHNSITRLPLPELVAIPAPYENEIVLGAGWQSNTGIRLGRFTGLSTHGFFGLGGLTLRGGYKWDSDDAGYYQVQATDLGLDSRSVAIKLGTQGTWGLTLGYDGIPDYYSNSFHTVWGTGGGLLRGIAPGSINNATKLAPMMTVMDIYTRRDILTAGGKYQVGDWLVSAALRHEHKEGTKENSFAVISAPSPIAANGNITTGALGYFPEPVNYDTDRYDINAQYSAGKLQALIGYTYNQFTDNNTTWNGQNPFIFTGATITGSAGTATAGSALVSSRYSLPPSNSAHQVKLQLGYNFDPTTRLNANLQYGLMMQNDPYVATTGNPSLAVLPLPKSSLDGAIQTVHANVALTAQPIPKSDLRISYTMDDRQSMTGSNKYTQYYLDATNRTYTATNIPLDYTHQTFSAQAGYRILPQTKVSLGYAYDSTVRTNSNTREVTQSTFNAKVRTNLWSDTFGSLGFSHEDRHAANYQRNAAWNALGLAENDFIGSVNYYTASRVRDEAKLMLDFSPLPNLSASLFAKADYDFYPNSALGLKSNNNFTIGPDVNYQFSSNLMAHAYYSYQMIYFNQGSAVSNACNGNGTSLVVGAAPCQNIGYWNGRNVDDTHSAGIGLDWRPMEDLKVSADYTFSLGRNSYSIMDGGIFSFTPAGTAGLQLAPIPDVRSTLNSVSLRAEYQLAPNASLWFGYTFERFNYKDYGTQVGAAQFSNALFSGDANSSYSVHLVMASLRLRW